MVSYFLLSYYYPFYFSQTVFAGQITNAGSNFTLCGLGTAQPSYTTESNPNVTLYWSFYSGAGNTQADYHIQISSDSTFASGVLDTGTTTSSATSYSTSTSNLSFNTKYYWRIVATDNLSSYSDWVNGDPFVTNRPSVKLQGGIKLQGKVKLK